MLGKIQRVEARAKAHGMDARDSLMWHEMRLPLLKMIDCPSSPDNILINVGLGSSWRRKEVS